MSLKRKLKPVLLSILSKLPYVKGSCLEYMALKKNTCIVPGHFYSTIASIDDIKQRQDKIWFSENIDGINKINLNTDKQVSLVKQFEQYYSEIPFTENKNDKNRYYFENIYYPYTDAIFLYSMLRHFRPKQIIEIGSGFSSSVMLDTNEQFLNNSINLTFIEPYPDRLKGLLRANDNNTTTLIEKDVQEVSIETFQKLNPGDFLFIDSTHVAKTGSDLNYILFEILPSLKSGVLIHFHDIFYPFEYPKDWVFVGKQGNENYFLKAFLMYNNEFEIKLFSHYLHKHHKYVFKDMPLCYKNTGSNLWLVKK